MAALAAVTTAVAVGTVMVHTSVGLAETYGTIFAVMAVVIDTFVEPVVLAETYEHAESVD